MKGFLRQWFATARRSSREAISAINLPPSPPPTTKRGTPVRSAAGALAWIAPPPLFLTAQLVAGSGWRVPYSWSANNISDLGNITCGSWGDDRRDVCSPLHVVMNVGFVATGLLIVAGVILLWGSAHLGNKLSSLLILFAGAGYVVVGLAPADRTRIFMSYSGRFRSSSPATLAFYSPRWDAAFDREPSGWRHCF